MFEHFAEMLDLRRHQQTGRRVLDELDDPFGRRVRAMRRAERVVDVDVGEFGELPGKRRIVLLLLGVEAQILQEDDAAATACLGDRFLRRLADAVGREHHRVLQQFRHPLRDRLQRVLGVWSALRASEMRAENDRGRPLLERVLDRR